MSLLKKTCRSSAMRYKQYKEEVNPVTIAKEIASCRIGPVADGRVDLFRQLNFLNGVK